MSLNILTKEDLNLFKSEIIGEMQKLILLNRPVHKKWLRSKEVERMLAISPATLQNYRISGAIKFSKVGNTYFYDYDEINQMLMKNSSNK